MLTCRNIKQVRHNVCFSLSSQSVTSSLKQALLEHSSLLSKQNHSSKDGWRIVIDYWAVKTTLALLFGQVKMAGLFFFFIIGRGQTRITAKQTYIQTVYVWTNPQFLSPCSLLNQKDAISILARLRWLQMSAGSQMRTWYTRVCAGTAGRV